MQHSGFPHPKPLTSTPYVAFLLMCILMGGRSGFAQALDYTFSFEHLTVDQGLSHSTVHAMLEDQGGMIWMGTQYGLNRYDGYDFNVFLPQVDTLKGPKGHAIYSLMEDRRGDIWIGHQERGLSIYSPKTGQFHAFPATDMAGIDWETISIRALYEDQTGRIWIGTYGAGLLILNPERELLAHLCSYCGPVNRQLSNDFVFDFAADSSGQIWIGTAGEGISVYNPEQDTLRHISGRPGDRLEGFGKALCLDADGNLWIGTAGNGLYKLSLAAETVVDRVLASPEGLSHNFITDVELDANGYLWVTTDGGGLNRFAPQSRTWRHIPYSAKHPGTLNTDALYDLMLDRYGHMWVGTFNGGVNLHRRTPSPFASNREYVQEQLAGLRSVLSMAVGEQETLWLGTDGAGLYQLDTEGSHLEVQRMQLQGQDFPAEVITSIATRHDGSLWLGTYGEGLLRLDLQTQNWQQFKPGSASYGNISHGNIWDLAFDAKGGLWIGTLGGGLDYLSPDSQTFSQYDDLKPQASPSLSGVQILDILLDQHGAYLWVATENAGLNRIDTRTLENTQFHHVVGDSSSLSSDRLRCLYEDREGYIWIGTEYAGLNRLNPVTGQVSRYSMEDGLPAEMINSIVQGPDGALWISTQAGIIRWDHFTNSFLPIGTDPYLRNNQFNPKAALALEDGRLIFGSTNGYALVVPGLVQTDTLAPVVQISDIYISSELVEGGKMGDRVLYEGALNQPGQRLHLSYKDRGIQFLLAARPTAQAHNWTYAYRLQGYTAEWQSLRPGERSLNYSGLPGGTYILEIQAMHPMGQKGPIQSLELIVAPPFWRTSWFLLICLVAAGLLLAAVIYYLLQRQRVFFREKAMQAEQEILQLRNENLEKDVANKQARLTATVLQAAHKNTLLNDIKAQIKALDGTESKANDFKQVIGAIDRELKQEDYWEQFQVVFDQTHTEFTSKLQTLHDKLTDHEKRLCCFIRMQLSNREISSILNITTHGVEQAKYRIKKKMQLNKGASLNEYIRKI